jgi:hypothetical protein
MHAEGVRLRPVSLAVALLALAASAYSAFEQDWTTDEPHHLGWSRRLIESGETERNSNLHYNSKTPVNVVNVAARMLARRALGITDHHALRGITRLPSVVWLGCLLLATFFTARSLLGPTAGHLAVILTALDPNLIANASLATVDVAYAFATVLTLFLGLRFAARPGFARGAALGAALGFAFLTKFTALLLVPGLGLLGFAARGSPLDGNRRRPEWRALALGSLAAVTVALLVICAGYRFGKVGVPLSSLKLRSPLFTNAARAAPALRLPVPADFVTGVDILLGSERAKQWNVVILGRRQPDGVWYYFALLWLLKTPVALLAALTLGLAAAIRKRIVLSNPGARFLLLNLLFYLGYFSFIFRAQIGYRFVLMCVPLAAVLAASGLSTLEVGRRPRLAVGALLLLAIAENAFYWGNHLAFTNLAVFPKKEAFRLMANSNLDWGQNDDRITRLLADRGMTGTHLNPVHILPGHNTLSFNLLSGSAVYERYAWLRRNGSPRGHIRHTYLWFEIEEAFFERFLDETRRFAPAARSARLCAGDVEHHALIQGARSGLPRDLDRTSAVGVCVWASERTDLILEVRKGKIVLGHTERPRQEWEAVAQGQESWYRLEPGVHALAVTDARAFEGSWRYRHAPPQVGFRRFEGWELRLR